MFIEGGREEEEKRERIRSQDSDCFEQVVHDCMNSVSPFFTTALERPYAIKYSSNIYVLQINILVY